MGTTITILYGHNLVFILGCTPRHGRLIDELKEAVISSSRTSMLREASRIDCRLVGLA